MFVGIWLVGWCEVGCDEQVLFEGVIDLDLVVVVQFREEEFEFYFFNFFNGMLLFGGDLEIIYVLCLGVDGVFYEVVWFGEIVCLEVMLDGFSVFLFIGLWCLGKDNGQCEQIVVLCSDDQGKSWWWFEEGFMVEVN